MALILGVSYPEVFAAIGVHSAPPYRSASTRAQALHAMAGRSPQPRPPVTSTAGIPPMIVFQGDADTTVRPANAARLTDQWQDLHHRRLSGTRDPDRITRQRDTARTTRSGRRYRVTGWYSATGRKMLETWQVERLGHAWSGGKKGEPFSDPESARASTEMWRFLSAHHLSHAVR